MQEYLKERESKKKYSYEPNERLKQERLRRGWSQMDVAEKIDAQSVLVARWETGYSFPSPHYRQQLCQIFEKNADELGLLKRIAKRGSTDESTKHETLPSDLPAEKDNDVAIDPSPPPTTTHAARVPEALQSKSVRKMFVSRRTMTILLLFLLFVLLGAAATYFLEGIAHPSSRSTVAQQAQQTFSNKTVESPLTTPVVDDSLAQQSATSQWNVGNNCTFQQGVYHVNSIGTNYCNADAVQATDFTYQIDVTLLQGPLAGLVFRSDALNSLYYFYVDPQGSYGLGLLIHNQPYRKLFQGSSSALHRGYNQTNTLTVIASGSTFHLFINGQHVQQVQNSALKDGHIGVAVGDYQDDTQSVSTVATYRNAKVWGHVLVDK